MKKILFLFSFLVLTITGFTQDEEERNGERIRERMIEYIQKHLDLSEGEKEKFAPVFSTYFNELRQTNQTFKGDRLVLQQKIVDLRIRYRDQFKPIMGEKRSNDVFKYEHDFINEVKELRKERQQNRGEGAAKRNGK